MARDRKEISLVAFEHGLVPSNPQVQRLARKYGWKPETVIQRIESALPAPIEQQLYLQLGAEFRIRPESLATLLRAFLGSRELQLHDFVSTPVGTNLVANKFADVSEYLEQALTLLSKNSDYAFLGLTLKTVAKLVIHFGPHVEAVIDSLLTNQGEIRTYYVTLRNASERKVVIFGLMRLLKALETWPERGRPNPADVLHILEDDSLGNALAVFEEQDDE